MKAIVQTTLCPLHSQPDLHSELADEALYGMVVDILEQSGGFFRVRTHYRYEGWAPAACLLTGDDQAAAWAALPKQVVLHKNTCDVMADPKVQSWAMASLPRGGVLSPVGKPEGGWQKVQLCDGRQGYTRASFLDTCYQAPPDEGEDAQEHQCDDEKKTFHERLRPCGAFLVMRFERLE